MKYSMLALKIKKGNSCDFDHEISRRLWCNCLAVLLMASKCNGSLLEEMNYHTTEYNRFLATFVASVASAGLANALLL